MGGGGGGGGGCIKDATHSLFWWTIFYFLRLENTALSSNFKAGKIM